MLTLSSLLRPSKRVIALSTHTFSVEDLSGMWAIRNLLSAYLLRLGLGDSTFKSR